MSSKQPAVPLPWERQKGETHKAFESFAIYRDMGPTRSLAKAATAHGKSTATLTDFSRKYNWVERAGAYDDYLDRQRRVRREEQIQRLHEMEDAAGDRALILALQRLAGDREADTPVTGLDANRLEAGEVIRLAETGSRLKRLAMGEPTDLVRNALLIHPTDVSQKIGAVIDVALKYIPEEHQAAFVRELQAASE